MNARLRDSEIALAETAAAIAALQAAHTRLEQTVNALSKELQNPVEDAMKAASKNLPPATNHRRLHRRGRPPKTDTDPEIHAFIEARITRMIFEEIAAKVATFFPAERRIGKSAIHEWWQREQKRSSQ